MTISIRTDDQISDVEGGWFRARWHYSFDARMDTRVQAERERD